VRERAAISIGVLCAVTACSSSDAARASSAVRDSSGITIVENHGPYQEWQLSFPAQLRIGTVDGDSTYQFNNVQFAGRLRDGRIVVVDNGYQIRWYDPVGSYRSGVGRRGRGPGEFSVIDAALVTPTDTLVVYDSRNRRATWLSPGETYVRDVTLREISSGRVALLGVTSDNRLAVSVSAISNEAIGPSTTYMNKTLTVMLASAGQLDTIARVPGSETVVWTRFANGRLTAWLDLGLPFGHSVFAAVRSDYYALANGEGHEIQFYDWTGIKRRVARRPESAGIPLTDIDKAQYITDRMEAARQAGRGSLEALEQTFRDMVAAIPDGHTMPSFDQLVSDVEGRIWLRDFVSDASDGLDVAWTVFTPDSRVERRVVTPVGLQVMHVGPEYITGVERDSLGVEYVVIYDLERRN